MTINDDTINIDYFEKGLRYMKKGNELNKLIPSKQREEYITALREFTQMTIKNPSFFMKTPEEQKQIAMSYIQSNKEGSMLEKQSNQKYSE